MFIEPDLLVKNLFENNGHIAPGQGQIRRNISIGIPLNLSIPTEMGFTQPLVENENSAKLQNLCQIFSCIFDINYKYSRCYST